MTQKQRSLLNEKYILTLVGSYIAGVLLGTLVGCLHLGANYLKNYFLCVLIAPIGQLHALINTWGEDDFLVEQLSPGAGAVILIIISGRRAQRNHVFWGVFLFTSLMGLSATLYSLTMMY